MKIGIVVPFSWSYWGGVVEHAEHQAEAGARLVNNHRQRKGYGLFMAIGAFKAKQVPLMGIRHVTKN